MENIECPLFRFLYSHSNGVKCVLLEIRRLFNRNEILADFISSGCLHLQLKHTTTNTQLTKGSIFNWGM